MTVVDRETDLRMSEGFQRKFGEDMSGEEKARFYKLARLAGMNPLVNTFAEIDGGIQKISKKWKPKGSYAKA